MATATINGMTQFGSSGSGADAGWGNIGAGPGGAANSDDFIEGTNSFGGRKTASGRGIAYTAGAGVNMSTNPTHIYAWINCKSISALDTLANGGMILRVGSSSANYRSFYIGGNDTIKAGWQLYVIDPTKTGSVSDTGSPNMASVTYIGVELTISGTVGGTSDNILMDIIRYATDPYITGGTSGDRLTWANIAAASAASAYGLVQERSGVYFVAGQIALGAPPSTAGDCYLDDGGQVVVWEPKEYENGTTVVTALASGFNSLIIREGTGTTDVEDGTLVGSGDDRSGVNGSVFKKSPTGIGGAANTNDAVLTLSGAITAVDMHGTVFSGFDGAVTLSNDATDGPNHVYAGVTWAGCEMVASGRVVIRNCTFAGYTGTQGAFDWQANANIKNSSFLGNTDPTNDPAGIYHQTEGDFAYIGLSFSGNDVDVRSANSATSIQSYANTNQDSEVGIGDGTLDGVGQSFQVSTAGQLVRAQFYLRKVGSPTGTATVRLYAHTGTFGSGGTPTGAVLVAANTLDVSTLTGTLADVDFYFEAAEFYDLTGGPTNYFVTIEYTGGDGSNYVAVGYDGSAPTSSGNAATLASAVWTAQTYDLIHAVWRDGEVQVNASSGANPATKARAGSPASAIAIINTVTHTVTNLRTSDRVVWIRVSDEAVLENKLESSGSASYSYNYAGATPIYLQILSGDNTKKNTLTQITLGAADASFTAVQADDNVYANP